MADSKSEKTGAGGCCSGSDFKFPMGGKEEMAKMMKQFCGEGGSVDGESMMEKFRDKDGTIDCGKMMETMRDKFAPKTEETDSD